MNLVAQSVELGRSHRGNYRNTIRGSMRLRGGRAAAVATALAVAIAAFVLAGCGDKGNPAAPDEKAKDVEVLNVAIGQDLALIDAYQRAGHFVHDPANRALLRKLVAQEQEHVDAWTKAMRGLGGTVEAEPEELDYSGVKDERDYLLFAYELTSSQLTHFLEDVTQLSTSAPRRSPPRSRPARPSTSSSCARPSAPACWKPCLTPSTPAKCRRRLPRRLTVRDD